MYFDEDLLLDLRLNVLDKYVDYFIIVESRYNHKGEKRNLRFNIDNFSNFRGKIIYLIYDDIPKGIKEIKDEEDQNLKSRKLILNAYLRENAQRNFIINGLNNATDEDIILISDLDEIPNLEGVFFKQIKNKIILFKQSMFYYKLNLKAPGINWVGTKCCRKRDLVTPQWLRNIKDKKYPIYRFDILFSKNKYNNLRIIDNGGWHFTNIKSPKEILLKLSSYLHHIEFDLNPLNEEQIESLINKRKAIYDLNTDKKIQKFGEGQNLEKVDLSYLPNYINQKKDKYKDWLVE
tara:strand:+ start:1237 stop:2109 length:873 start_codon:yes stop_codon:yes gene_type:complete